MNTMQKGLITLLKSAVTQQGCVLPQNFDLEKAYSHVMRHHMDSIVLEGAVLCGISQELPVMQQLWHRSCKALMSSERQMNLAGKICAAFAENGIDYMPLKGCKMKLLYPRPELRTMGDIDILIRMEQYDRIIPIVESLGFRPGVESNHELQWYKNGLLVELHKRVIPSYNKDFYAYFGEGWNLAVRESETCFTLKPEDEMVYQFVHFAKHYRDGGIGCRHVLDLWIFKRANPDLDEARVKCELDKLGLWEFYDNIFRMIRVWFEDAPADEKTDFITDYIFASGSWGERENHVLSASVREQKGGSGRFARLRYLLRVLFPDFETLKNKYTILQKAPWMLPFVWIYRPFLKIFSKKERKAFRRHKDGLKSLTPDKLKNRQQALQYVGLKYNF